MSKKNTSLFNTVIVCFGLILLILITFFWVMFGPDKPKHQQEISVILYEAGNGAWESLLEGLKRAEEDYSVNIHYVTLRENADAVEQIEMLEREIENGAEGIILAVNDCEEVKRLLLDASIVVPVVAVESGLGDETIPFISADNYAMGKQLGEEILMDFNGQESLSVTVLLKNEKKDSVQLRKQGLCDALEGRAEIQFTETLAEGEQTDVVAALDKENLQELVEIQDDLYQKSKKYGIGNSASIVAALDMGKVEKIVFQNEFNMGYLAVEKIVNKKSNRSKEKENIDFYSVSGREIYDQPFEQLLFPLVE